MSGAIIGGAAARGAAACLAIAAPAALLQARLSAIDDGARSGWVYLTLFAIVVAYLLGGLVAATRAAGLPMVHGAAAAVAGFAVVQTVAAALRFAGGEGINPLALVFNALLAAAIGTVGAGVGVYRSNRAGADRHRRPRP